MVSIMRSVYKLIVVFAALLLIFMGCAKEMDIDSLSPDTPLLRVGEDVLMTAGDFQELLLMQDLSEEIRETAPMKQKSLFVYHAEYYVLSYFAEEFGLDYSLDNLSEEYDFHLEEIEDTEVYGNELKFLNALQDALNLTDQDYKSWYIRYSVREYNTANLIEDLTGVYGMITDPVRMEELILENLHELCNVYEVEILYEGVTLQDLSFESVY